MKPQNRINVLGSKYSAISRAQIHSCLLQKALTREPGYVCVSNVHTTMMGFFNSAYQNITNESMYSVPDGLPLVWAMNSLGAESQDRVRGPTLMRDLMDKGRPFQIAHYLYGGSPTAVAALKQTLESLYPGVKIVGAESPPFQPIESISPGEWEKAALRMNQSGAHFIWIGLGAPKQELWMWQQRNRVNGIMLGVGAAFDLISGKIPEAPTLMQSLGLEWLYRFYKEPRRLWRRYLFNNPAFLVLWAWQWIFLRRD